MPTKKSITFAGRNCQKQMKTTNKLHPILCAAAVAMIATLISCSPKSATSDNIIPIDLDAVAELMRQEDGFAPDEATNINDCDIIDNVEYVRLETSDEALIGDVHKIIVTEDRIFVADLEQFQYCHIFDRKGKFIKKLNRRGRAGNEYTYLADIFYNPDNQTINLLGRYKAKILSFDKDGNEVAVHGELPAEFTSMEYHNGKYYGATSGLSPERCDSCYLVVMNGKFEIEKCLVKNGYDGRHLSNDSFYLYDGDIFFANNWLMQVIDPKSKETRWEFDFGSYRRPKELDDSKRYFEYIDKNRTLSMKVKDVHKISESKNYIVCEFDFITRIIGIYNKQTKSSNVAVATYIEQPYALPFGDICSIGEGRIISTIQASSVARLQRGSDAYGNNFTEMFPEQVKRLQADFPPINDDDNPFIAIYTLKE